MTFLIPPLEFLFAGGLGAWLGGLAWLMMSLAYLPMVRFYGRSPIGCLLLPAAALVYLGATIDSARRYWQGRGGTWKGRVEWRNAP